MKLVTVVGARPQFVKAAVVSRAIKQINRASFDQIEELILHTGQHHDQEMSDSFFETLGIPSPHTNLNIHGGSHAQMTGRMLISIEEYLEQQSPDKVLVYGDTNSTLAGALAASKLGIPIVHVEAGLRSYNRDMPEEINRVLTDHLSSQLHCPTSTAVENLKTEGILKGVHLIGDVMLDSFEYYRKRPCHSLPNPLPANFVLATVHRAENIKTTDKLKSILNALVQVNRDIPVILPLHPGTMKSLQSKGLLHLAESLHLLPPVSYLTMIKLLERCKLVLTDSGGLQKEAYFARRPCVTLRSETEWSETLENDCNTLVGSDFHQIVEQSKLRLSTPPTRWSNHYGTGDAGLKIANALLC